MQYHKVGVPLFSAMPIFLRMEIWQSSLIVIKYNKQIERSQWPYYNEEIHHSNTMQSIGSKVNTLYKERLLSNFKTDEPP